MKRKRILVKLRDLRVTLSAWAMEVLAAMISHTSTAVRFKLIRAVGALYGWLARGQNSALTANLKILLQLDGKPLAETVDQVFKNFSMTLYDFFYPDGIHLDVLGREKIEKLRQKHGGILVLTFHMGNWELGAFKMREWGWPVTAVYQPYQNKKFKQMIEKRRAAGLNFIPVGRKAAAGVSQALKRGDIVAMLGDHPFGEAGIPVNLLGHRVIWPKGPVVLAMRENAPIVVAVVLRNAPRHYVALIEDPIFTEEKSKSSVERLVQEVANKFGRLLQQNPTQWYRFKPLEFVEKSERFGV